MSASGGNLDNLRALVTAVTGAIASMEKAARMVATAASGFSELSARADLFLENTDQPFLAGALTGLHDALDETTREIEIACTRVDEGVTLATNDLTTLEKQARQDGSAFETAAGVLAGSADAMLERVQSGGTSLAEEVDELLEANLQDQQQVLGGFRRVADLVEALESGLGSDLAEASVTAFTAAEHGELALQGVRQAASTATDVFASRVASISSWHKACGGTVEQSYADCQEKVGESVSTFLEGLTATLELHRESIATCSTTLGEESAGPLACARLLATVLTALAEWESPLGAGTESTVGLDALAVDVRAALPIAEAARAVVAVVGGE